MSQLGVADAAPISRPIDALLAFSPTVTVLNKHSTQGGKRMAKKRKKLRGSVHRMIVPTLPEEAEKAEIDIEEADDLYREIRVEKCANGR